MSFFAVLREADAASFTVHKCHINLWSLSGVFRRKLVCDVGLHVEAAEEPIRSIELALPFMTHGDALDLYDRMSDDAVAALIWGEHVTINRANPALLKFV